MLKLNFKAVHPHCRFDTLMFLIHVLLKIKGCQNWITRDKDKFKFPGGGTQFIHGADGYLEQISKALYFGL